MTPDLSPGGVSLWKEVSGLGSAPKCYVRWGSALEKAGCSLLPVLGEPATGADPCSGSLLEPLSFEFLGTRGADWDLSLFR